MFKKTDSPPPSTNRLAAGDAARDSKDWSTAIAEYEAHLAEVPSDSAIWVQLGNCAKEAGDYRKAEAAYNQSLNLKSNIADTHLQLGHLCKIMGRWQAALNSYREAHALDSQMADAAHEIDSVQRLIADLPFLMPPSYLDIRKFTDLDTLIAHSRDASINEDPFRAYAKLIEE